MVRKSIDLMAIVVVMVLFILPQFTFSVAQPGGGPRPMPPQITAFNINNNAECTYNLLVTLNSVAQGGPTEYRVSQRQDFSDASWKTPYSASVGFNLSPGLGTKTVYFQARNRAGFSNVVSDTIVVKQRPRFETGRGECDQPGISTTPGGPTVPGVSVYPSIDALNITIAQVSDPFKLDINYEILVKNAMDANRFSIELRGESGAGRGIANIVFATTTMNYTAGTAAGGQHLKHTGRLTLPIPYDQLVFISGPQGRSTNIFVRAEVKLPSGFTVSDPTKLVSAKMIALREHAITVSHSINACMGSTGDRGNWGFNLSSQVPAVGWVGRSNLDLHDCPDLKCDRNPLPALGERLIRWEKQPSTADKSGTVHWACEGGGNVMQGGQPLFRFTVKTSVTEPSVAP